MAARALAIPTLVTPRLTLAPLTMRHSAGMFDMWRHEAVQQYSGPALDEHRQAIQLPARTHHDSDQLIKFWLKAAEDGWGFRWAVTLTASEAFAGHIGFNSLLACSEIAYHMNPAHWGHGIMNEAGKAAIDWRFRPNALNEDATEIEAFIEPANTRSIALATRLGLVATTEFAEGAQRYCLSP